MTANSTSVDVLVIGGGVVGCSILRELSRYNISVALVEKHLDVCDATSKANSGIVHTGFDAPPGTLEARLLAESRELWPGIIDALHIPYLQTGAIMPATTVEEEETIRDTIIPKAEQNGVSLIPLSREEILEDAPYITDNVRSGVLVEGEAVIDPFWTTRAYAESAILNGAKVYLGEGVTALAIEPEGIRVTTSGGSSFVARMVVNAAGLWADEIARLADDDSFQITPRKGQFIVSEDTHGVSQIVLPVPSKISKGILVTPIVFGGVLLGPTAEDMTDKSDLATTSEGLAQIRNGVGKLVPAMGDVASIRQFAGLRTVSSTGEYIIRLSHSNARLLHVAGIRSTGLSASPGIGRYVASLVRDELGLALKSQFTEELPEYLAETQDDEADVICLCRSITRGELMAALRRPLPPRTLDGLKRRTGAMLGDCQGNLCIPRILDLYRQQLGRDPATVEKNAPNSSVIAGPVEKQASVPQA